MPNLTSSSSFHTTPRAAATLPVRGLRALAWLWALCWALCGTLAASTGMAQAGQANGLASPALVLKDSAGDLDAWPMASVLSDSEGRLSIDEVLLHLNEFRRPNGPYANLGVRGDVVWFRIPIDVPETDSGRWMLNIDYPSLDRVDVHVVTDGIPVNHVTLGDNLPMSQRPLPTRSHATPLRVEPGMDHVIFLRVQTTSSMIVPVRFVKPETYMAEESRLQMLQGLAAGLALCMMLYSLTQWLSLRDAMFLYYAGTVAGITLFFVAYYGLGPQHLWPESPWLTGKVAPLAILLATAPGFLFLDATLGVAQFSPRASRLLRLGALLALIVAALFALDVVSYRSAHLVATLLGPWPILLGVPVAFARARRGDRAAHYLFAGWLVYSAAVVTMAALLRGWVDSNEWTQHAFQAGSLFEMVMWLLVLGVRTDEIRRAAEHAGREREALRSLAQTDALTGVLNRRGLMQQLGEALQGAVQGRCTAVFLLDLDGFKDINDQLGHDAGDALLVEVARRLKAMVRTTDAVARLGGDEFVVVANHLPGPDDARRLGQKLLDDFRRDYLVMGKDCRIGATIGMALASPGERDAGALLKCADAAMYSGKRDGKHCLRGGDHLAAAF